MRRSSKLRNASLVVAVLGVLGAGAAARAQPCCAGTNLLTPARLAQHEDELVAVQVKAGDVLGSFAPDRSFVPPGGAQELDLEQDLIGTVRVLGRGQVSLVVPLVETHRAAGGYSEWGGGLGDITASARWDFINAREAGSDLPGVAVLAGVGAPTGTAPESAKLPLQSDATGTGAWQLSVGVAVEQSWRHLFLTGLALFSQPLPRHVQTAPSAADPSPVSIDETLGLQISGGAVVGWAFDSGPAVGLTVTYFGTRDVVLDGVRTAGTGRAQTAVGLGVSKPLWENWRLQGSLVSALPLSGLGQNEPASLGLSVLLIRGWM
jgi:hypothetical protein